MGFPQPIPSCRCDRGSHLDGLADCQRCGTKPSPMSRGLLAASRLRAQMFQARTDGGGSTPARPFVLKERIPFPHNLNLELPRTIPIPDFEALKAKAAIPLLDCTLERDERQIRLLNMPEPAWVPWMGLELDVRDARTGANRIGLTSSEAGDPEVPFTVSPEIPFAPNDQRLVDLQRPIPVVSTSAFTAPLPPRLGPSAVLSAVVEPGGGYSLRKAPPADRPNERFGPGGQPLWMAAPVAEYVSLPVGDILRFLRGSTAVARGLQVNEACWRVGDNCNFPAMYRSGDPQRERFRYGFGSIPDGWQLELSFILRVSRAPHPEGFRPAEAPAEAPAPLGIDGVFAGIGYGSGRQQNPDEESIQPAAAQVCVIGSGNSSNALRLNRGGQAEPTFANGGRATWFSVGELNLDLGSYRPGDGRYGRVPALAPPGVAPHAKNRALVERLDRGRWQNVRPGNEALRNDGQNLDASERLTVDRALRPRCRDFRFYISLTTIPDYMVRMDPPLGLGSVVAPKVMVARINVEFTGANIRQLSQHVFDNAAYDGIDLGGLHKNPGGNLQALRIGANLDESSGQAFALQTPAEFASIVVGGLSHQNPGQSLMRTTLSGLVGRYVQRFSFPPENPAFPSNYALLPGLGVFV